MRVCRGILSMMLLVIIFIGSGGIISQYFSLCSVSTQSSHHDCCHCEEHQDDCDNHRFALDHECSSKNEFGAKYIAPSPQNRLKSLSRIDIARNTSYMLAPQGVGHEAIRAIITFISRTEPWRDDDTLRSLFDPSTAALRAPPVLV